jgi:hypothetical protein
MESVVSVLEQIEFVKEIEMGAIIIMYTCATIDYKGVDTQSPPIDLSKRHLHEQL